MPETRHFWKFLRKCFLPLNFFDSIGFCTKLKKCNAKLYFSFYVDDNKNNINSTSSCEALLASVESLKLKKVEKETLQSDDLFL